MLRVSEEISVSALGGSLKSFKSFLHHGTRRSPCYGGYKTVVLKNGEKLKETGIVRSYPNSKDQSQIRRREIYRNDILTEKENGNSAARIL